MNLNSRFEQMSRDLCEMHSRLSELEDKLKDSNMASLVASLSLEKSFDTLSEKYNNFADGVSKDLERREKEIDKKFKLFIFRLIFSFCILIILFVGAGFFIASLKDENGIKLNETEVGMNVTVDNPQNKDINLIINHGN